MSGRSCSISHCPRPGTALPGDADVTLDLQLALTTVYDLSDYDLRSTTLKPPEAPLSPEASRLGRQRLRAAGLRP